MNNTSLEILGLNDNQIQDITPLSENEGFSEGDKINIRGNPLNINSYSVMVPRLLGRGVNVLYDKNQPPARPVNVAPEDEAKGLSLTTVLQASEYFDAEGNSHVSSHWQVMIPSGNQAATAFSSGEDTVNLTDITIPTGKLDYSTIYYWRVRYKDEYMNWSEWSVESFFTTVANQPPGQPTNVSPLDGTVDVSVSPVLESSSFSDPEGHSHNASQWQITDRAGKYDYLDFDSGEDANNLTYIAIPSDTLKNGETYYWRVRYRDNHDGWSEWSEETSFQTIGKGGLPTWAWAIIGIALAFVIVAGAIYRGYRIGK
jgi:hypothetical protein